MQAHLEAVSGTNLTEFFNDWVYGEGYPTYSVTAEDLGGGQAKIIISQTQSHPSVTYFEMPVTVRLTGEGNETFDAVLDNTTNGQEFVIEVPFIVTGAEVDPERDIICANSAFLNTRQFDLQAVKIYPNPVKDILKIQLPENAEVQKAVVYNMLGSKEMEFATGRQWDLSSLSAGVYFIRLVTNGGAATFKFIKE